MIKCKAIRKIKDHNNVTIGYVLKDESGQKVSFKSEDIKQHIKIGALSVENLKVTSDNKLIYSTNKAVTNSKTKKSMKYDKISHIEAVNTKKNKTVGYTNYSDVYDFHSPMQSFEYNLPETSYKGYIKDKKNNVYMVEALEKSDDAGRIAGGATKYYVTIKYGDDIIRLSGYRAVFSKPHYNNIIEDIAGGYYLEDYLTKNKGAIDYNVKKGLVESIVKDNVYNSVSESERLANIEKERKRKAEEEEKIRQQELREAFDNKYKVLNKISMQVKPNDDRLSEELKQRENIINGGYVKIVDKNNSFAVDKDTNKIYIVNKYEYKETTNTAKIKVLGFERIINRKGFNPELYKEQVQDYDDINNFMYEFRGNLIPLKDLVYNMLIDGAISDAYPEDWDKSINRTVYTCGADGEIQYNIRSDVFYFIDDRRKKMISLSLSHDEQIEDSEIVYKINEKAYDKFNIHNFVKRASHKAYKKHANSLVIWVNG